MLHFFTAPAARYLAAADIGSNSWWRYLLGIVVIAAGWIIGGAYAYGFVLSYLSLGAITEFVAINASILTLGVAVVVVVVVLHRRPWRTLVTPYAQIDWWRIGQGAAVWVALALVFSLIEHLLYPGRYAWSLDLARWLPFALAALLLTPLQCAAEELVFRGYVIQGLGRLLRNPLVLVVLSGLLFAIPHLLNPEVAAYGLAIMAANYFVMGLFLGAITLRDGRLELAIGAHAGNNLLLALVVRYDDSVFETESVFTAGALDPVYSLLTLLLSAVFFYWWFFRRSSSIMSDSSRLHRSKSHNFHATVTRSCAGWCRPKPVRRCVPVQSVIWPRLCRLSNTKLIRNIPVRRNRLKHRVDVPCGVCCRLMPVMPASAIGLPPHPSSRA